MVKLGVSYYGCRIPWRAKEDLKAIREAGCTYVVHTFSEEDLEFYQEAVAEIVGISRELGLEVWLDPWGVGQVFGGETYSNLIAQNLSVRQVDSDGESLGIACPNQPAFRDFLDRWIEGAARCKPDVLFWDEPHFKIYPEPSPDTPPRKWACRCAACREKFEKEKGTPMPERMTDAVRAFKEDSIVAFTQELCDKTRAKGLKSSVCLLPFENSSTVGDWSRVARIPSLDILGTDPYWRPHQPEVGKHVGRFSRKIAELAKAHGKEGQVWILNFNIPQGEEPLIRTAIEAAYGEGIRNLAAWSYYGASYIKLKADDPKKVWETLSACYRDLQVR